MNGVIALAFQTQLVTNGNFRFKADDNSLSASLGI